MATSVEISVSPQLTQFVADLRYEDIPVAMVAQAKKAVWDNLGVLLAGLPTQYAGKIADALMKLGDAPETNFIGYPDAKRVSLKVAAMHGAAMFDVVNGMSGYRSAINPALHTTEATLPVALVLSRSYRCSGKEFLTALIAGFETFNRIGLAVGPSHYLRGFFPDATLGCLASSVVAAKLHNGSATEVADALGAASYFVPMTLFQIFSRENRKDERFGIGKVMAVPYGVRAGMDAAFFAANDFGGQKYPLEGSRGFCNIASDGPDLTRITEGLGSVFVSEAAYYKKYFTTRSTHGAIDLALKLREEHGLHPRDIKRVHIDTTYMGSLRAAKTSVDSHVWESLSGSMPYVVAHALLYPEVMSSPDLYTDTTRPRRLPEVHEFAERVQIEADPELDKLFPGKIPTVMEIETFSGQTYSARSDFFRGDEPESPLTADELTTKFHRCAEKWLSPKKAAALREMADNLEELDDMSSLFELCQR